MWETKFTVAKVFRSAVVFERADYVAVNLCNDEWYVIKARGYKEGDILTTPEHDEQLLSCNQPIVLDYEYLATDEHGKIIVGW